MTEPASIIPPRTDKTSLDPATLFQIQEMFSKATSMAISTFDGFFLQVCPSSNINAMCKFFLGMRSENSSVTKKCLNEHFTRLKEAGETGKPVHFRCWLGLDNTAVPLTLGGKCVGTLSAGQIYTETPDPKTFEVLKSYGLDPDHCFKMALELETISKEKYEQWIQLLSTIANAVVRERHQQLEEKKRAMRLQFISDLSRHLGEDIDQLLGFIAHAMPAACDLERCTILLLDEKNEILTARASNAYSSEELTNFRIPVKNSDGNIKMETEPFVSSDAPRDPRLMQEFVAKCQVKSLLTIPLKVRDKILGLIHFSNSRNQRHFTQEEVDFISVLAAEVALAIEATLMDKERRAREEELNRFREEVQGYFTQIGRAISSALNIENLLYLIADLSMRVVKADGCSLYLIQDKTFKQEVAIGYVPDFEKEFLPHKEDYVLPAFDELEMLDLKEEGVGTLLRVPLKTQEETIGFLNLYIREERSLSKEILDVVAAFAAQTALSIKNVVLLQAEQEKAKEIMVVYEAAKAISVPLDLSLILQETAERLVSLAQVERCLVFLLDEERRILSTSLVHGASAEQKDFFSALAIPLNFLEGTLWQHFKQGRPVIIQGKDLLQSGDPLKNLFSLFGTKSCLLLPLLSERKLSGLVYLDKPEEEHQFTESQIRCVMSLSIYAAASIERAQLFKQLEDQAKQVHTLYQISTALSTSLNLERILNLIIEKTTQLVKADRFCLFMWDDDKEAFVVTASRGLSEEFIKKAIVKIEDRFVGLASYRKKPIYSANILLETDNPQLARLFKKEGLGAVLAVPLVTKRKTIGVVTVFAELGYQFKEKEIHLLGNFASHAALSIENARLYNLNKQKVQELGILFDVGKRISVHLNPSDVLRSMAEQFLWVMRADGCSIMLLNKDEKTFTIHVTRGITRKSNLQKKIKIGEGIVGEAARTGQPVCAHDEGHDETNFPEALREEGIRTILSVPLATKEETLGVVNLYTKEKRDYAPSEMHIITTLAEQGAVSLQNARIFEEHYHVAQLIQKSLLPEHVPNIKGIEIGFQYLPSQEISGDYYDFLEMRGKIGIAIADVSGKGTGAAIFTAQGKYAWKAYGLLEDDPQIVLTLLNRLMVLSTPAEKFVSMFYGVLDYKKNEFVYSNAGHLPPLLYRGETNECRHLAVPGLLLGIDEDAEFVKRAVSLRSQDVLLFYTDGVTEARNESGEIFGLERLEKIFVENARQSPQIVANRILTAIRQYTRKRTLDDDVTIVALRVR